MKNASKPRENSPTENRGGRPTREEAERRRILAVGVDPALVDWRRVAAGIAVDEKAPATARVAACRLLAATGAGAPLSPAAALPPEADDEPSDELSRRALEILAARGRPQ